MTGRSGRKRQEVNELARKPSPRTAVEEEVVLVEGGLRAFARQLVADQEHERRVLEENHTRQRQVLDQIRLAQRRLAMRISGASWDEAPAEAA